MMTLGFMIKWDIDDARFTDYEGEIFHNIAEATIGIMLSVMARKDELMDEYNNDKILYDTKLNIKLELTFEQWVACCIDNFCNFKKDWYYLDDVTILGK